MKKLLSVVVLTLLLPFTALAQYEEGKHYEVIAEQATAKPEVKEEKVKPQKAAEKLKEEPEEKNEA